MPIFVYKCDTCGHEVEKLMKFTDPAPHCTTEVFGYDQSVDALPLSERVEPSSHSEVIDHGPMTKQLTAKHKFCQAEGTVGGFSSGTLLV